MLDYLAVDIVERDTVASSPLFPDLVTHSPKSCPARRYQSVTHSSSTRLLVVLRETVSVHLCCRHCTSPTINSSACDPPVYLLPSSLELPPPGLPISKHPFYSFTTALYIPPPAIVYHPSIYCLQNQLSFVTAWKNQSILDLDLPSLDPWN